jgi:hypothetical protein
MGALYLCSALNIEAAMTQTAEWILPALFVGICQRQSSKGKGKCGDCLAITSFHRSKDTRP